MNDINTLFRRRVGISQNHYLSFDDLDYILEKTARALPFENMAIMTSRTRPVSKEHLIDKLLISNRGGLCYELNPILHLFLLENNFVTEMIYGRVFDGDVYGGKTHVAFLVKHSGLHYLVDTGFGGNLPLKPVPLTGGTVQSRNGVFRISKEDDTHVLKMNLSTSDKGWTAGYKFYINNPVESIESLDSIRSVIENGEKSVFNKDPLVTSFTEDGRHTLTSTHYTVWSKGKMTKTEIDADTFGKYAEQYFNLKY